MAAKGMTVKSSFAAYFAASFAKASKARKATKARKAMEARKASEDKRGDGGTTLLSCGRMGGEWEENES